MPDPVPSPRGAWNVFLSSTVRDLRTYRKNVREACRSRAQTLCLLSEEDWPFGYDETVTKCIRQIDDANGFLLLIGHWYGSVPKGGGDRSITHIEFEAAFKKWQDAYPRPIAVMMPAAGSHADKELRKAAIAILTEAGLDPASHDRQLSLFRDAVTDSWRTVYSFKNKSDLREMAIACCLEFKRHVFMAAATGAIPVPPSPAAPHIGAGQLGALGREPHLTAARTTLAGLADCPDVPAVAMIAMGDEDAGQREFLQQLIETVLKKYSPRREPSTLPVQGDADGLAAWVSQLLGLPASAQDTPALLAERVAVELKRQPLLFSIDRVNDLTDGASAFQQKFWLPFYEALLELRRRDRFTHRLVALVGDYSADACDEGTCEPAAPDYSRLVRLPRLAAITRADILKWFDEMDVPDDASGRRAALADRVMKGSKGVPLRVFSRLRGEQLWPAGETE